MAIAVTCKCEGMTTAAESYSPVFCPCCGRIKTLPQPAVITTYKTFPTPEPEPEKPRATWPKPNRHERRAAKAKRRGR